MITDFNCPRRFPMLVLVWIAAIFIGRCLLVSGAKAQAVFAAEEVTVPTLEWVVSESDRNGLGNMRIRQLLAFVDSLEPDEIEPTINRLMKEQAFGRYLQATQMLYAKWWKLDRDAALEHALALEGDDQWSGLGNVLPLWATDEPMKAWQWFEKNSDKVRANTSYTILREIVRTDPPLALKMFAESEVIQNSFNESNPSILYATWASQDPAAAAAHLDANSMLPLERASIMFSITSSWIRRDVDAAWQWAKSAEPDEVRARAMETFITLLALRDLERAEALIQDFPEGKARQSAASNLVSSLYLQEPEKAFAILQKHGGGRIEGMILGRWAIRDAAKALEVAKTQLPVGPRQQQAFNEIIGSLARRDIDQAIKVLEGFGPQSNLTHGATMLSSRFADQDFEKARSWAESLSEGEIKKAAMSEIVSEWVDKSAEDAATYSLAKAAADPSSNLLRSAMQGWGYKDPKACAKWIVDRLEEGGQLMNLPTTVGNWAQYSPEEASKWAGTLPEGKVRDACFGRLGSQWGYHHPTTGVKWLEGLKAGKGRDEAISNFANRAFEYFPEKVLEWCTKIDDPKLQERAIQQNAHKYLRSQPEKARLWIKSSSLSDKQKKSLLGK